MVDDILLTPEEQDERAKQWLKDNGMALALGIGLGLAAVFGYNTYQEKLRTDAEAASATYHQIITAVQNSEISDISADVEHLKAEYASTAYAPKASLIRAKQLAVSDADAAITELNWVVENANEAGVVHAARIRKAKLLLAEGRLGEAKAEASIQPDDGFTSNYAEILGDIAVKEQDFEAASTHYQQALDKLSPREYNYSAILTIKRNRLPIEQPSVIDEVESSTENGS